MSEAESADNGSTGKTKSIWDNDLPAGDAPPLPDWPLKAAIATYAAWMVILIGLLILRLSTPT